MDCELLREVYINLVDQKEPMLSLNENNEKIENTKKTKKPKESSKIIIKPNEKEYLEHKKFLKEEMKKNYF